MDISQEEELWKTATFVFDANILLDTFKLSLNRRDSLIFVFEQLCERLWLPYQTKVEFERNREEVISKQLKLHNEFSDLIQKASPKLGSYIKHPWINSQEIEAVFEKAKIEAMELFRLHKESLGKDDIKTSYATICSNSSKKIEEFFYTRIGPKYTTAELLQRAEQASLRLELRIPPGFMDAAKPKEHAIGDTLIWYQMMEYSKSTGKPILFVTEDKKDDWWQKGVPHPELLEEFKEVTGNNIWFYTFDNFFEHGVASGLLKENRGLAQELRELRTMNIVESLASNFAGIGVFIEGLDEAEILLQKLDGIEKDFSKMTPELFLSLMSTTKKLITGYECIEQLQEITATGAVSELPEAIHTTSENVSGPDSA